MSRTLHSPRTIFPSPAWTSPRLQALLDQNSSSRSQLVRRGFFCNFEMKAVLRGINSYQRGAGWYRCWCQRRSHYRHWCRCNCRGCRSDRGRKPQGHCGSRRWHRHRNCDGHRCSIWHDRRRCCRLRRHHCLRRDHRRHKGAWRRGWGAQGSRDAARQA